MDRRRRVFWRIWCGVFIVSVVVAWIALRPGASFLTAWHLRGIEPPRLGDTLPNRTGDRASDLRALTPDGPAIDEQPADRVAAQESFARLLVRERRHALRKLALFLAIVGLLPPLLAIATAAPRWRALIHQEGNSHALDGR